MEEEEIIIKQFEIQNIHTSRTELGTVSRLREVLRCSHFVFELRVR